MNFVLDFIITMVAYMLFPFILFKVMKKNYSTKITFTINFINSIVIMTFFIALRSYLGVSKPVSTGAPAMLYLIINNALYPIKDKQKNGSKEKNEKIKNKRKIELKNSKNKKKIILISIISTLVVALSVSNVIFIVKYMDSQKRISEQKEEIERLYVNNGKLFEIEFKILKGYSTDYVAQKLSFFNDKIVFVIDGYGNYYSDYDCTMQRVGNNKYTYWAFNVEYAKSQGFKEYKCK